MANRDWFSNAFGATAEDIRHKLVEEGWFGRTVTPRTLRQNHEPQSEHATLAEQFGWGKPTDERADDRVSRPTPQQDHDLDR